jgi:hypothetical protein
MKNKKTIVSVVILLLGLGGLQAQNNVDASGGEAIGSGGKVSYSVGQVFYTSNTGSNGSVADGVQQPYEISVITGVDETAIEMVMNVYPNPTTSFFSLEVKKEDLNDLEFTLFDMQGRVMENKRITTSKTTVDLEGLPIATYFLKVTDNNEIIKTFKILKQ